MMISTGTDGSCSCGSHCECPGYSAILECLRAGMSVGAVPVGEGAIYVRSFAIPREHRSAALDPDRAIRAAYFTGALVAIAKEARAIR